MEENVKLATGSKGLKRQNTNVQKEEKAKANLGTDLTSKMAAGMMGMMRRGAADPAKIKQL